MEAQEDARVQRRRPRRPLPPFPELTVFTAPADFLTGDSSVDDLYEHVANLYTGAALICEEVYNSGSVDAHDPKSLGKSNQGAWKEIRKLLKEGA